MMFMMFAMTTDSVGVIIPEVIKTFHLSMTAAGAFHYANMSAIAIAAIALGFLADLLGRKKTIIFGLILFALNSYLFSVANTFSAFIALLIVSGAAIGIFKTGALALIGDISHSTQEHTSTMNLGRRIFWYRRNHRPRDRGSPFGKRCFLEVAVCHRRNNLRSPHCDRVSGAIPNDDEGAN